MDPRRRSQKRLSSSTDLAATSSRSRPQPDRSSQPTTQPSGKLFYFSIDITDVQLYNLGSQIDVLRVPYVSINKFADVKTDIDLDSLEYYQAGKIPAHHRIYYEPKVIRVRNKLYLAQFRYCPDSNTFRWHTFGHPVDKPRNPISNRHFLSLPTSVARLEDHHDDGTEEGTTRRCSFEDVLSFLRFYGVTNSGKIFVALPECPIMTFGPKGTPFPPLEGKITYHF